jgi:large subunit ribosomal protein L40
MYDSMQRAVEELKKVDEGLFYHATVQRDPRKMTKEEQEELKPLKGPAKNAKAARIEGLFPREMRLPTDTPRTAGWDHGWKAPKSDAT